MWISGSRREKKTGYLYLLLLYDYTILLMCRRFSAWYAWSVKRVSPPLPKYSCSVHCCRCTNLFFVSGTTIAEITRQSGKVGDCSNHSMLWCANKRYKRRLSSRSPSHSTFRWAIQPPFHSSLCRALQRMQSNERCIYCRGKSLRVQDTNGRPSTDLHKNYSCILKGAYFNAATTTAKEKSHSYVLGK